MNWKEIKIHFREYKRHDVMPGKWRELVELAKQASDNAWAPYSGFKVGAALRLSSGRIVTGNNQENAAYPAGLCAERTALFYANANFPDDPVEEIAVSAQNDKGYVNEPVKPCGGCRQALLEVETRFNKPVTIILCGEESTLVLDGIDSLLPLNFKRSSL